MSSDVGRCEQAQSGGWPEGDPGGPRKGLREVPGEALEHILPAPPLEAGVWTGPWSSHTLKKPQTSNAPQ